MGFGAVRKQEGEGRWVPRGSMRRNMSIGRGETRRVFKVVLSMGLSSLETQLFAHPPPKTGLSALETMGFIRGPFACCQLDRWQPPGG